QGCLAVAAFDERQELAEALAERVVLLPVPLPGVVARRAHEALFVQQVVFGGGDEPMEDFENLELGSCSGQRLLQFIGLAVDGAMLVVELWDKAGVGLAPFEEPHRIQITTIGSLPPESILIGRPSGARGRAR